jgi:superfamily II DNA/RNA helicase
VLPLLNRIHARGQRPAAKTCSALILAPTRELASQIADSIRTYGREMRVSVTVILGGVKPGGQIRAMARGTDIVVATPGRLLDHVQTGVVRLDATETVILDEADQMLDLGFMPTIRKILAKLPKERQTLLLSATMPKQIRALANDFLDNPSEISVAPTSRPIERIDQSVMHVERDQKRDALVGILRGKDVERAIVFTRTKRGADKVCEFLQKAGINSGAIHGNKSQPQRERTLAAFRDKKTKILVARKLTRITRQAGGGIVPTTSISPSPTCRKITVSPWLVPTPVSVRMVTWCVTRTIGLCDSLIAASAMNARSAFMLPALSSRRWKNEFSAGSSCTGPRSRARAVSRHRHHWLE